MEDLPLFVPKVGTSLALMLYLGRHQNGLHPKVGASPFRDVLQLLLSLEVALVDLYTS